MSNLNLTKTTLFCFVLVGCAEPPPTAPPVLDAIGDMNDAASKMQAASSPPQQTADDSNPVLDNPAVDVPQSGIYTVEFDTTAGKFAVEVNREWAPIGADRFYKMVNDGFYDGAGFFRVVPGFMVQWGMAADPAMTAKWGEPIMDDPVVMSNTRGYITFAKTGAPNSRSGQVFINFADNSRLDRDGFAPFGKVTMGMDSVDGISSAHRESPDQNAIRSQGSSYLKSNFPKLDYITTAKLVTDDLAQEAEPTEDVSE